MLLQINTIACVAFSPSVSQWCNFTFLAIAGAQRSASFDKSAGY
jgi:hypothetical protein